MDNKDHFSEGFGSLSKPLTMADLRKMSLEEINKNWDEVKKVLNSQKD